jgi:hypothetical protein
MCGKKVLSATIRKTGGLCMPCYKGQNPKSFWDRAEDLAMRMGVMKHTDRVDQLPIEDQNGRGQKLDNEPLGISIEEILKNRKTEDDFILISHLCGLLMEKENTTGFDSFSKAEESVYLVGDMIRQLDSGGFGTYFYNTGHLASKILKSLDEIGAEACRELVEEAISIYGKVPSEDYDEMLEELAKITDNFEYDPWEEVDSKYYELDEKLGEKLMNYVSLNQGHFLL